MISSQFKICNICQSSKSIDQFSQHKRYCRDCKVQERKIKAAQRYQNKRTEIIAQVRSYQVNNSEKVKEYQRSWTANNREKVNANVRNSNQRHKEARATSKREYNAKNKEKTKIRRKKWEKQKLASDPAFKLRRAISRGIREALKSTGGSKRGKSIFDFLPYSLLKLKNHLEAQFEDWMNWKNWGIYCKKTWNDHDPSTWTWQIDHIYPQSKLPFQSMSEDNFLRCWGLNNLRPISAKQNHFKSNKIILP